MKRILILLICPLLLLSSCQKKSYRNDLSAEMLVTLCSEQLSIEDPVLSGSDAFPDLSQADSQTSDVFVCYAGDGNCIDEFGVFKTDADKVKAVRSYLQTYLSDTLEKNRAFYDSYIPLETPKLRNAEVRIFGSYVAYAILSEDSKKQFFEILEAELTPPVTEKAKE